MIKRQRGRRLHRDFQILSRHEETERPVEFLSDDHDHRQKNDRHDVLHQHRRLDQHPDRHEEDRPEQVLDRSDDLLDALGLYRPG